MSKIEINVNLISSIDRLTITNMGDISISRIEYVREKMAIPNIHTDTNLSISVNETNSNAKFSTTNYIREKMVKGIG